MMAPVPRMAMLLSAGLGKRLLPLTQTRPKPLIPVAGKPLIDWCLDLLERSGVQTAVVNVHHLGEMITSHLQNRMKPRIVISEEYPLLLDSGGGVVKALPHLGNDSFLIVNSDTFWIDAGVPNLERMAAVWNPDTMDILLLLSPLDKATGYSGIGDFVQARDGRLARIDGGENGAVYAGGAIVHPRIFADAPAGPHSLNLYFDRAIANGRLFGITLSGQWITVGTPQAITSAETLLSEMAVMSR